jgi:hypothetical protein
MKKAISGIFKDVIYTYVDYVKDDPKEERFHVYERVGFFNNWTKIEARKTLAEAEEIAKNRAPTVAYKGIYENGKRKAMTDWEDKQLTHSPEQVRELRRKSYEGYNPEINRVDGSPVPDPKYVKAPLNKEVEHSIEVEKKFSRRLSRG